ncbi:hypothetical protein K493DRAFT_312160 [Basidiobolus meristosporus CBS 931.73]|uniref:Uncharacterized protein n=1 Tax=Basidiobolus meristosporus CBS 931.73 TaxID=1314790 RepID=A0A1Y1YWE2_9FUNG|nr:hypothetical protein K493DRAFT_312160 [Basidiobolus meristosporus CBS 931.73]|eukprot:ORY02164.1 hypothetical protein K493DRAFT_312160 [Basidiobolus meristosporus CBS 931.73]
MGLLWILVALFIAGSFYFFNGKAAPSSNAATGDVKQLTKKKKKSKSKASQGEASVGAVEVKGQAQQSTPAVPEPTAQKKGKKAKPTVEAKKTNVKEAPVVKPTKPEPSTESKKKKKKAAPAPSEPSEKSTPKVEQPTKTLPASHSPKQPSDSKKNNPLAAEGDPTSTNPIAGAERNKEEAWYKEEVAKPPARVMKIKGPEPESASEEEPEEGWIKIKRTVHSPKPPARIPTNIELLEEKTVTGQPILTKTQRKNARRALKRKEERDAFQQQQEVRLRQHRRELMNARIHSKDYAPKPEASRWNVLRSEEEDANEDVDNASNNTGLIWDV